jgi:hypothetical protein
MRTGTKYRGARAGVIAGALILAGTGCQDLFVPNEIEPDRERALGNPSDVEAFIGAAYFPSFFRPLHGSDGGLSGLVVSHFTYAGADMTSTLGGTASVTYFNDLMEPRQPHNNAATICSTICEWGPRDFWGRINSAASIPYDALQILDAGMIIRRDGVDVTPRARAFAKFMQGWSWGYSALMFDRVHVIPENVPIPDRLEDLQAFSVETLVPSAEAIQAAVRSLEEAIAIARLHPGVVNYPAESPDQSIPWFASPTTITNAQFIQMANTLAARLLVLGARNPQERAQVDWQKVLQLTGAGVTPGNDWEVLLNTNRSSQVLQRLQSNVATATTNGRWNYRTIGLADQSGSFQQWINASEAGRNRFDIVTPDRRITGPTPQSHGSYTCYRTDNNGFLGERGLYRFSAYQWSRHRLRNGIGCVPVTTSTALNTGTLPTITADENALLRAEALLRTGNLAGAAAMINVTRTRQQRIGTVTYPGLPPVTAAGVPEVGGVCVPRTETGACGSLMTAVRYERLIEMAGTDAIRNFADARGFGMLPAGTPMLYAVPGNVLDQYGLPNYTFGGVGMEGSATFAPTN